MGILSSLRNTLFGIKEKQIPADPDGYYDGDESTEQRLEREKAEAARERNNHVMYGKEKLTVIHAGQSFYGDRESPGFNKVILSFHCDRMNHSSHFLHFEIPLPSGLREIGTGIYKESGYLIIYKDTDDKEREIKITDGEVEIKQEEDQYFITATCICENKKRLTLHYTGDLKFHNKVPDNNGKGHFLYKETESSLYVAIEKYAGIVSQIHFPERPLPKSGKLLRTEMWLDQAQLQLKLLGYNRYPPYYILLDIYQKKGNRLLPGEYRIADGHLTPAGTFRGYVNTPDESFESIKEGTLQITRSEHFTIEGNLHLANGQPLTFTYTGKPEWYDES